MDCFICRLWHQLCPSLPPSLALPFPLSLQPSPSLLLQIAGGVKLVIVPYHIQLSFLQDIHQHLNLGLVVEDKVIVHPENIFGGDLRYGQVSTSKPTL